MNCDILSLAVGTLSLIFAIVIAVCSYIYNSRVLKTTLHLDFSKRYQDLMTAKPDQTEFTEKFALLYFDLCSEEYRLKSKGRLFYNKMIDEQTWRLWEEGMEDTLQNHRELKTYWEKNRKYYGTQLKNEKKSFQTFFDEKVELVC